MHLLQSVMRQTIIALNFLHSIKLIHTDLKVFFKNKNNFSWYL